MKIELTSTGNIKVPRKFEVYALAFEPLTLAFTMPYCVGDDWGQELRCPVKVAPTALQFQWDRVSIHFAKQEDADAFAVWLVAAEKTAKEGYRTMRG